MFPPIHISNAYRWVLHVGTEFVASFLIISFIELLSMHSNQWSQLYGLHASLRSSGHRCRIRWLLCWMECALWSPPSCVSRVSVLRIFGWWASIWWETRVFLDNFRRRTFRLVVDRLSIGPGGESPCSRGGIISCCSVFVIPPNVQASITVRPVSEGANIRFSNDTLCTKKLKLWKPVRSLPHKSSEYGA